MKSPVHSSPPLSSVVHSHASKWLIYKWKNAALGAGGRRFKSSRPDQQFQILRRLQCGRQRRGLLAWVASRWFEGAADRVFREPLAEDRPPFHGAGLSIDIRS